jgi:prepilin-type N-terminal cleavage/methylation domain-containing protein
MHYQKPQKSPHSSGEERRRTSAGFTLIEMLIAFAIVGFVMGGILMILVQSQASYTNQTAQAEQVQRMRIALDQITRVLRQAGNDPMKALAVPPVVPGQGSVQVHADISGSVPSTTGNPLERTGDPDGLLNSIYEVVTVSYDPWNRQVLCDVGYGPQVTAEEVDALTFTYYDVTGAVTADPARIARVKVTIAGRASQAEQMTKRHSTVTLESDVFIRSQAPQIFTDPNLES